MTVELDEYREELIKAAPELEDTLEGVFHEAARMMSPVALKDYLDGARALISLGKSSTLLVSYLDETPQVVKDCGEDAIRDVIGATMKLASMVSGEVLTLMISTLPGAAQRLGDPDLLRGYLQLLHRLAARAPRGLRPMFGVLEELLAKLTLSGLRRWVDFGADAYRRDLPKQADYFGLVSEDSREILKIERRGTLFIDSQRRLNLYLRAFWGRDFFLRPSAADHAGFRPFIEQGALHLPDAVDSIEQVGGVDLYRAMCAHMAAHITSQSSGLDQQAFNPAQIFFIGMMEDARVEYRAINQFPGLGALFDSLISEPGSEDYEHETMLLLHRLAKALLSHNSSVGDKELDEYAARFHDLIPHHHIDLHWSQDRGLELYNILAKRRIVPSLRILESLKIPYRDDNRYLWKKDEFDWFETAYQPDAKKQIRRNVGLMEFINEIDAETAGDDAQEIWVLASELYPYEDEGVSFNEMEGKEPISDPFHYSEWDYKVQLHRPSWATVYERRAAKADPDLIDSVLSRHKGVSHRIRQIIDRLRPQGICRQRRLEDGDELDINAAVDAMVMSRIGMQPDTRITMRNVVNQRDLAVLVLLDLSESTNETVRGADKSVLDLTREASALVSSAISGIGDPFAIHGFSSDGRHDVRYYRFKDFDQRFDDDVKGRLAGMMGGLSTRMGAAMRHAAHHLGQRNERHKLLLIVTDGEPADIDERDPQYLRMDAKKASLELQQIGVMSFCLTLDPKADQYVSRIFGANNYTIVDQVERLPEKLPSLFANLTK